MDNNLDTYYCFVCEKPVTAWRRMGRPPRSLESVDDRLAHRTCEKYNRRLEKAKKVMERAEEEIMSMEFAIFLKKTHPVPIEGI